METRVKKLENYVAKEVNGQRWRRITPITNISNLFVSIGGFGMLAWFAVYIIGNFDKQLDAVNSQIKNMYSQNDINRARRDAQVSDMNMRISCVAQNVKACCTDSANC